MEKLIYLLLSYSCMHFISTNGYFYDNPSDIGFYIFGGFPQSDYSSTSSLQIFLKNEGGGWGGFFVHNF